MNVPSVGSLNPCFVGIWSCRLDGGGHWCSQHCVLILVLLMKEHPVDGPIGLDREVAREYCRVVKAFTTPSFIYWYGTILVLLGYGLVGVRRRTVADFALS